MREEDLHLLVQTINTVGLAVLAVFTWLNHRIGKESKATLKSVDDKITDHIETENLRNGDPPTAPPLKEP